MPPPEVLPAEAYWEREWLDKERSLLFARTWTLAGSQMDLATPGDVVVVDAGTDPLFVVRDEGGALRAFHNLCPHRGYKLVSASGRLSQSIRCDYHFWNFLLDGRLRHIPQAETQFPGLDKDRLGLRRAAVAIWEDHVLVHPDPKARLEDWLGPFPSWLGTHRPARYVETARTVLPARCNWKLFVENHVDVLHLWYLHARTLGIADHDLFEWWQAGPHWGSYEPMKDLAKAHRRPTLPGLPGLDSLDVDGVRANLLFPNLMVAATGEAFLTYVARPTGPETTALELTVRTAPGASAEEALDYARPFLVEDIRAAERVQETVRSGVFGIGTLALEHEAPILAFQAWVRHFLSGADAPVVDAAHEVALSSSGPTK